MFCTHDAFVEFQKGKGRNFKQSAVDLQVKNVAKGAAAGQMRKAIEKISQQVRAGHIPIAVVNMPTRTKRGKEATRLMAALPLDVLAELLAIKHQWEVENVTL